MPSTLFHKATKNCCSADILHMHHMDDGKLPGYLYETCARLHESLQLSSSSSSLPAKAWRIVFAFSRIAATFKLVLGP